MVSFDDTSDSDSDSPIASSQPKHFMKPPKFDGNNVPFESFFAQFQNCVRYNGWSRREQVAFLKGSVGGEAAQVLWDSDLCDTNSLSKLTELLKSRFGGAKRADKYRMELRSRVRQAGESLEKLHQDIRRYMALVFSNVETKARDTIACDYFIDALDDVDLALKVRERNPKTLDEALHCAQQIEVWMKEAARKKGDKDKLVQATRGKDKAIRGVASITNEAADRILEHVNKSLQKLEAKIDKIASVSKPAPIPVSQAETSPIVHNSTSNRTERRCFNCDEVGHLARQCKKHNSQAAGSGNRNPPASETAPTSPTIRTINQDKGHVYMPVQIRKTRMQCTLDSGSDITRTHAAGEQIQTEHFGVGYEMCFGSEWIWCHNIRMHRGTFAGRR